jgi:hypothetical protein
VTPTVVAFAGRRVDAPGARRSRFPPENARVVGERVRELLARRSAAALVSAAACGADLVAQEAAGELGLRRIVVLPFARGSFRERSVTDRPGAEERWGPAFDRLMRELPAEAVIELGGTGEGTRAFAAANEKILDEALALAHTAGAEAVAVIAWDGERRGEDDLTAAFADAARGRGMEVEELSTL